MQFQPWYESHLMQQKKKEFESSPFGRKLIKEKKEREKKEKEKLERQKKISQRLRQPLFKGGVKTKFKGGRLGVSAEAGIKGLLRI